MSQSPLHKVGNWVVEAEDERPARRDGTCFYCCEPIGGRHAKGCVIPQKLAKIEVKTVIEIEVPAYWDSHAIEFYYNDGSSCSDNIVARMREYVDRLNADGRCLCNDTEVKVLEIIEPKHKSAILDRIAKEKR